MALREKRGSWDQAEKSSEHVLDEHWRTEECELYQTDGTFRSLRQRISDTCCESLLSCIGLGATSPEAHTTHYVTLLYKSYCIF